MADIFVSYAAEDRSRVEPIVEQIAAENFSIWWDRRIGIGTSFDREIESELDQANCVIVFWTQASILSDWVRSEAEEGLRRGILVPICMDDVTPPLVFRRTQAANFYQPAERSREFASVITAIRRCLHENITVASNARDAAEPIPAKVNLPTRTIGLFAAPLILIVALVSAFLWYNDKPLVSRPSEAQSAKVRSLIAEDKYMTAFEVLLDNGLVNATTQGLFPDIYVHSRPAVAESGVAVSFKPYGISTIDWIPIGQSPFTEPVSLPRGELLLQLEQEGQAPLEVSARNPGPMFGNTAEELDDEFVEGPKWTTLRNPVLDPNMKVVSASNLPLVFTSYPAVQPLLNTPEFGISQFEVSNEEYKLFVDEGGYENLSFWAGLTFTQNGKVLSFNDAQALFVDRTGRHGPATWELGSFAEGQAKHPVGGISWYEAVAYARYRRALLPTIHHWIRAAFGPLEPFFPLEGAITHNSNFESDGPVPVTAEMGIGPWGTFNTAGNVREWVWNELGGQRIVMGGSWDDYGEYSSPTTLSPFDRRAENGMRLVQRLDGGEIDPALLAGVDNAFEDRLVEREPISDDGFEAFKLQYSNIHRRATKKDVSTIKETDVYDIEQHRVDYSRGEALTLFIFNPRSPKPPWQIVIWAPPSDAVLRTENLKALDKVVNFEYILRGGRTVVVPIWEATYDRGSEALVLADPNEQAERERETVLAWHRDAVDTIDYLESLPDRYKTSKIALFGASFGAASIAPVLLATEPRITTAVFLAAGTYNDRQWHPMADNVNYAPRIHQPVLMLTGRYDHFFPLETSAKRLFNLLGTQAPEKRMVLFDGGHADWPRNQKVKEVSDWLDQYLGPVR